MQKKYRLRQRSDFNKVYRFGRSVANRQFVIYKMPHRGIEHFQVGISISKKIGHAVLRNRLKRQIKEIIRLEAQHIKRQVQFIVIVRNQAVSLNYDGLQKSLIHILKKARLWDKTMI